MVETMHTDSPLPALMQNVTSHGMAIELDSPHADRHGPPRQMVLLEMSGIIGYVSIGNKLIYTTVSAVIYDPPQTLFQELWENQCCTRRYLYGYLFWRSRTISPVAGLCRFSESDPIGLWRKR